MPCTTATQFQTPSYKRRTFYNPPVLICPSPSSSIHSQQPTANNLSPTISANNLQPTKEPSGQKLKGSQTIGSFMPSINVAAISHIMQLIGPAIMSKTRSVLTPKRLLKLSKYPHLTENWYYIAAAAFTICNRPEEVPKIFHMALSSDAKTEEAAESAIKHSEIVLKISQSGPPIDAIESISGNFISKKDQLTVSRNMREALLKGAALGGLPRSINALTLLRNACPMDLRERQSLRAQEPENLNRGLRFWSKVYGKIDERVKGQLRTAYPDLLEYALHHVYGPLLSYTGVLSAKNSSLVVIGCLVPQDVNPQLKGHLRGAQNNGASLEEITAARDMSVEISDWCGVSRHEDVAKL